MKGTCVFVASVVAASTVALTFGDRDVASNPCANKDKQVISGRAGKEKYAPRFDGLRFIETLITAHRRSSLPCAPAPVQCHGALDYRHFYTVVSWLQLIVLMMCLELLL